MFGDIEKFKTYTDDIIVFRKDCFKKHIYQPSIIFVRLRAEGLNVNAPKCDFGLKDIPYLSCVIKKEGIKPYPKKVQGIMDIGRPATTTEAQALIGMVHYYIDM